MKSILKNIPLVILAGGFGTRISEETNLIPKPMIKIGNIPIILHIMNYYSKFGVNEFIICAGYKSSVIDKFFKNFTYNKSKLSFILKNTKLSNLERLSEKWKINIVNTGVHTMTGGRIKKIARFIKSENFFMTYGDGLSNVNLYSLARMHLYKKKIASVTAVKPLSRYGYLKINNQNNLVSKFLEKPIREDWINGGYFLLNKKVFKYISNSQTTFEKEPMEKLAKTGELIALKHHGFWQSMDTMRDKKYLDKIWKTKKIPWI
jgi:glucose-1-phosphate cytidylyltransferase